MSGGCYFLLAAEGLECARGAASPSDAAPARSCVEASQLKTGKFLCGSLLLLPHTSTLNAADRITPVCNALLYTEPEGTLALVSADASLLPGASNVCGHFTAGNKHFGMHHFVGSLGPRQGPGHGTGLY